MTITQSEQPAGMRPAGLWWILVVTAALVATAPARAVAQAIVPGFNSASLAENDDGSTGAVPIGFTINFFGVAATTVFVNNNGNVTFDSALSTYTPFSLDTTNRRIIAPFFADVDTRTSGGTVTYGAGAINGRPAFGVNWLDVDYYNSGSVNHTSRNSFQLILIDRSDTGPQNFDFWFNYNQVQWETGQASGGDANGLGGFSARAGYANGQGTFAELSGSGVNGALLDSNLVSGLVHNSLNSGVNGRYVFQVRNGSVVPTLTITTVTPRRGSTAGGTPVTVTGTNFLADTTVTVGGRPATGVELTGTTRLAFVSPPGNAGAAPLVIANSSGSTTSTFEYLVPAARLLAGSRRPALNYDGRYTAFESRVALVAEDTNGVSDIYVYDKLTDSLRRVSISSVGSQALGGESTHAAISATGRFVAFQSRATNLVPRDTNGLQDVFLHDRDADGDGVFDESHAGAVSTTRVNVTLPAGAAALVQALGGDSGDPSISGNGRWVAFESLATNLVSDGNGQMDVFVHDRLLGVTRRVSEASDGTEAIGGASRNPAMSLDGRFVAFDSAATNLVPGDSNAFRDVFVRDRDTDGDGVMDEAAAVSTTRVSVATGGQQATGGDSVDPSMTEQGRWVAFGSRAVDLVPNDTNGESDVFLHDRQNGTTVRLSQGPNGAQWVGPSFAPSISANGALLLFLTSGLNAPPAGGGVAAGSGSISARLDDGKSTTGSIPLPTAPAPPPPTVDPLPPTSNTQDPVPSGDGTQRGSTQQPAPGSGNPEPSVTVEGPPTPAAAAAPLIADLEPAQGPAAGGNTVNIRGSQFQANATVVWNGIPLSPSNVFFQNSALLRVTAPAAAGAGAVQVRVQSGGQSSNTRTYTYVAGLSSPRITSSSPASGSVAGGETLTINGTGFQAPSVRVGPYAAAVVSATATTITATVPAADVAGPVPIVVTNGDGAMATSDGPYTYLIPAPVAAPSVTTLQPASGPATGGTAVTIRGNNFSAGVAVTVGGAPAADVQVISNTELLVVTPAGAEGPATVAVDAQAQLPQFRYLAAQTPVLTCAGADGDGDGVPDPWESQYGLSTSDATDGGVDHDADGRTTAQECTDGTHPRGLYTRYLAEGATGSFFDTRVAVANPNVTPAHVLFRFLTGSGQVVPWFLTVPANARRTIDLHLLTGLESANVSSVVESDVEIVVDRTMRWNQQLRNGAHAETSVAAPALRWYLAEGATHGFFDLFYLIQNPSLTAASQVQITFLLPTGAPMVRTYTVNPNTRHTLQVDAIPGLAATDVSAVIESTNGVPVIVERAMYSSATGVFAAGHNSAGIPALSTTWFFAEGATGRFFDLFLLFANPNTGAAANVEARYLLPNGTTVTKNYVVPPTSRRTVYVAAEDPALADTAVSVAVRVTNGLPIIVERAMWWPSGQAWFEAHNSAGSTVTGTKWGLGDGEVGFAPDDTATFILVANTAAVAATVRVTLLFETGAPVSKEFAVAANSRFNVPVLPDEVPESPAYFRVPRGTRFSAVIESLGAAPAPIVVERAMYWNANGVLWAAGSNLLATRLQ